MTQTNEKIEGHGRGMVAFLFKQLHLAQLASNKSGGRTGANTTDNYTTQSNGHRPTRGEQRRGAGRSSLRSGSTARSEIN